jgi:hypothetical protein
MTYAEYVQRLKAMTEEEFQKFRKQYGGDGDREAYIRRGIESPKHEKRLCQIFELPTQEERLIEAQIKAAEATAALAERGRKSSSANADANVLISWSKARSKKVALKLHEWLPTVLPSVKPWMSTKDIRKGKEWFKELKTALGSFRLCIVCVTSENVNSPWLFYEAGAIAAKADNEDNEVLVFPYLIDTTDAELHGTPLHQLQCTIVTKDDTFGLIESLNQALEQKAEPVTLREAFDKNWSSLQRVLRDAAQAAPPETVKNPTDRVAAEGLNTEERQIIQAAAAGQYAFVHVEEGMGGSLLVQAGSVVLYTGDDSRLRASWFAAVDRLHRTNCLVRKSEDTYELTKKGFSIADSITGS